MTNIFKKRLRRWLFKVCTVAAFLPAALIVSCGVVSCERGDCFRFGIGPGSPVVWQANGAWLHEDTFSRALIVDQSGGSVMIGCSSATALRFEHHVSVGTEVDPTYLYIIGDRLSSGLDLAAFQFVYPVGPALNGPEWALVCPHWFLAALAAAPPLMWLSGWKPKWRAGVARGLCTRCGYDLRATPNRCPECGTIPTHVSPASAVTKI